MLLKGRQVLKLHRSLYGLKQSPRNWNTTLNQWLISIQFERSLSDPCLYIKKSNTGKIFIVIVYVDDLILGTNCLDDYRSVSIYRKHIEKIQYGKCKINLITMPINSTVKRTLPKN
mmetsp:Transcript_139/g.208  ORF Transcript_139/g.208 Transcript_139/m.208 type:complete len:116 (+) Transcript_139:1010-1357(+)